MAVLKMQKVRLCIHRSDATTVLRAIQKLGVLQFTEVTDADGALSQRKKSAFEFNYVSARLDFAVEFLSNYAETVGGLRGAVEGTRVYTDGSEIYKTANSFYYNDIIESAQTLQKKLNKAKARIQSLEDERTLLSDWNTLDMSLSLPRSTETTTTLFITMKPAGWATFTDAVSAEQIAIDMQDVSETNHVITFFTKDAARIEKKLHENEGEIVELPQRRGTSTEEIERIGRAIVKEQEKIVRREERAREMAKSLPDLKKMADYMYWKKNKHNVISSSKMTDTTLVFEGWCPEAKFHKLERSINAKSKLYTLETITPAEDEEPPVEIENNALITPFESVTRLYGLPGPKDLDPTLFLSGFFFIFFGLSLTDVGYGIILSAVSAYILLRYRVPSEMKPIITLLMFGGISSAAIGLLFGGYFGIDMSLMPAWLQSLQQFDPIANPIPVFYLALVFGVVQILVGLILSIVSKTKNGSLMNGLLDDGPWIALFATLIAWGGNLIGFLGGESTFYVYGIYAAVVSLVLTQGRKEEKLFTKLAMGVVSLYDSISYFSDILSYSRLLALGLATSALAFAVNLIAGMVAGVPYVGFILVIAILIVGHLFNLAVNVLGAFIHSARLQFVEFFGKFITGTGRDFKPFKREERYVVINNK